MKTAALRATSLIISVALAWISVSGAFEALDNIIDKGKYLAMLTVAFYLAFVFAQTLLSYQRKTAAWPESVSAAFCTCLISLTSLVTSTALALTVFILLNTETKLDYLVFVAQIVIHLFFEYILEFQLLKNRKWHLFIKKILLPA